MKAPEKPKIVLQLAHAKDCPANYIKNDIDLCPCGYNDNEQKLARWATYSEQEITRLTSALERAREEMNHLGEAAFRGNWVSGKCNACGNSVKLKDSDIPVKEVWIFQKIRSLLKEDKP